MNPDIELAEKQTKDSFIETHSPEMSGEESNCTKKVICISVGTLFAIGVLLLAILLGLSLKRLDSTEIGIMYNQVSKSLGSKIYTGGLHLGPVGYKFITAPSVFTTLSSEITCLNKDGVEIRISVTYQYKIKSDRFRDVLMDFKSFDGLKSVLVHVGESVLHDICSEFNILDFQYERKRFTDTVRQAIKDEFESYYTLIAGLQITNYERPKSFEAAVEKKITAFEDINVAEKERKAAIIEADTKLGVQRVKANITVQNALSYENIRTTQADNKAATIKEQFENEIKVYSEVEQGLALSTKGLLSYMGVRAIENSPNNVHLAMKNPADVT